MEFQPHLFMPGQTIVAVIKLFNGMVSDPETLSTLIDQFNQRNNFRVPKVGLTFEIPVMTLS